MLELRGFYMIIKWIGLRLNYISNALISKQYEHDHLT